MNRVVKQAIAEALRKAVSPTEKITGDSAVFAIHSAAALHSKHIHRLSNTFYRLFCKRLKSCLHTGI